MNEAADLFAGAHRVLIVQLSAIGDVLRAGSVVSTFKRVYPSIRIGMLVFSDYAEVLDGIPQLTYRHVFPNSDLKRGINAAKGDVQLMRAVYDHAYLPLQEVQLRHYDVAVNFHFSTASAYLTALSGARKLLGMAPGPEGRIDVYGAHAFDLYDDLRSPDRMSRSKEHLAIRYHRMCGLPEDDIRIDYHVSSPPFEPFSDGRFYVAVHVGGGWPAKCWPSPKWRELIKRMYSVYGWIPVLLGTAVERDRKFAGVFDGTDIPFIDLCGRPFEISARAIASCSLFIGADSGPMHLASALDVPVVALFGPTSPLESYPLRGRNAVIRPMSEPRAEPALGARPTPEAEALIRKTRISDIEVDEVWNAMQAVTRNRAIRLPTWAGAGNLSGAILYENPRSEPLPRQNVA